MRASLPLGRFFETVLARLVLVDEASLCVKDLNSANRTSQDSGRLWCLIGLDLPDNVVGDAEAVHAFDGDLGLTC
jgi:hypothetical protein